MIESATWLFGAVTGGCFGSYAATAALRLAQGRQSLLGRSACDNCGATLGYGRTLPILSFLAARGACRDCSGPIDRIHLVGEVGGVLVVAAAFIVADGVRAALIAVLGLALLAGALVDAKVRRLPNWLTLVVALAGAALAALDGAVWTRLAVAGVTFVGLEFLRRGYLAWRGRAGLGFGDVKLMGALALWLGTAMPTAIVLASALGLAAVMIRPPRDGRIAFGPFIAVAAWTAGLFLELGR